MTTCAATGTIRPASSSARTDRRTAGTLPVARHAAPLLVTDAGLAHLPMVARAAALCREAGLACELFSDVQPNPVEANVTAASRAIAREPRRRDRLRGGSALDAAKAIALMSGRRGRSGTSRTRGLVHAGRRGGHGARGGRADDGRHGLGGWPASVLTDLRDHTKKIIFHPKMLRHRA